MLADVEMLAAAEMPVDLQVNDVEAHLEAREIAAAVDAPGVMEYWKSTPYLLSFMDRYQLSERVLAAVQKEPDGAAAQLIRRSSGLQLPRPISQAGDHYAAGGGPGLTLRPSRLPGPSPARRFPVVPPIDRRPAEAV